MSRLEDLQYENDIWDLARHAVESFCEECQVEVPEKERLVDYVGEAIRGALEGSIRVPTE